MAPTPSQADRALLLLPALSPPLSRPSFQAAYRTTFDNLFARIKSSLHKDTTDSLTIAIAVGPWHQATPTASRTELFNDLAELFQEVYSLIVLAAVSAHIDLDLPGGIDARVVLIDSKGPNAQLSGPVVDLSTLIKSRQPSTIFSTEAETGIKLTKDFTILYHSIHNSSPEITQLPSGPSLTTNIPTSPLSTSFLTSLPSTTTATTDPSPTRKPHHQVAVGGTFDHLHIGHKLLLTATILLADPSQPRKITIGITGDALLVNKKHASALESWSVRQQRCAEFVESILCFHPNPPVIRSVEERNDGDVPNGKVVAVTYTPANDTDRTSDGHAPPITINYTQIQDPFGPTITDENITALVVTAETRAGGKAVNDRRKEKGWAELEVFEVGVLDSGAGDGEVKEGFEGKIGSTEIRRRIVEAQEGKT
jgi:phosphopantetheine adenylyltransferase